MNPIEVLKLDISYSAEFVMEALSKYDHRHADALENCFCVSSITALPGGQYQRPVNNLFWLDFGLRQNDDWLNISTYSELCSD